MSNGIDIKLHVETELGLEAEYDPVSGLLNILSPCEVTLDELANAISVIEEYSR